MDLDQDGDRMELLHVLDGSSTGTSETAALYEYGQLFHTLRTPGSHELDHTLRPAAPTDVIMMAMPRPNTDCSDALEPQCHGAAQNLCASGADMDVHSWKCNDDCCLKSQLVTTSAAHQGAAGGEVAWRSIRMEHEHGVAGLDSAGSDRFDATGSLKMNTLVAPSWLTNAATPETRTKDPPSLLTPMLTSVIYDSECADHECLERTEMDSGQKSEDSQHQPATEMFLPYAKGVDNRMVQESSGLLMPKLVVGKSSKTSKGKAPRVSSPS